MGDVGTARLFRAAHIRALAAGRFLDGGCHLSANGRRVPGHRGHRECPVGRASCQRHRCRRAFAHRLRACRNAERRPLHPALHKDARAARLWRFRAHTFVRRRRTAQSGRLHAARRAAGARHMARIAGGAYRVLAALRALSFGYAKAARNLRMVRCRYRGIAGDGIHARRGAFAHRHAQHQHAHHAGIADRSAAHRPFVGMGAVPLRVSLSSGSRSARFHACSFWIPASTFSPSRWW